MGRTSFLITALMASIAPAQEADAPAEKKAKTASPVERGRYLVHHVAMCVVCHSPRTENGRIIEERLLEGAPMPVSSPFPRQTWAFRAPSIAGLGGFSEEAIVTLLQTGARPNGEAPKPPMPPFRMTEEDARAVVAYLKSAR
ncbi:MAG: cytochrome c [Planctomycetes bacterium]|nr:cytochrome c [Planctomycetota bacterium]